MLSRIRPGGKVWLCYMVCLIIVGSNENVKSQIGQSFLDTVAYRLLVSYCSIFNNLTIRELILWRLILYHFSNRKLLSRLDEKVIALIWPPHDPRAGFRVAMFTANTARSLSLPCSYSITHCQGHALQKPKITNFSSLAMIITQAEHRLMTSSLYIPHIRLCKDHTR